MAISESTKHSLAQYRNFLGKALADSAGAGRAVLKTFERDGLASYEDVEQLQLREQGASVAGRMCSRINSWGIQRWKVHKDTFADDMDIAGNMLKAAAEEAELPSYSLRHLRDVLRGGPVKTGFGLDHWLSWQWAELPDDVLVVLLSLVYLVQQGVLSMQMLVVLVALIFKASGGERPIALTLCFIVS